MINIIQNQHAVVIMALARSYYAGYAGQVTMIDVYGCFTDARVNGVNGRQMMPMQGLMVSMEDK